MCGKRSGAEQDRTADLLTASQALSQLSYGPTYTDGMLRARNSVMFSLRSQFPYDPPTVTLMGPFPISVNA